MINIFNQRILSLRKETLSCIIGLSKHNHLLGDGISQYAMIDAILDLEG